MSSQKQQIDLVSHVIFVNWHTAAADTPVQDSGCREQRHPPQPYTKRRCLQYVYIIPQNIFSGEDVQKFQLFPK
jgi:hypothetical protein